MSSHLSVSQTLELLRTLQGAVHDVAARERQLHQEFRVKTSVESNRFETAAEEQAQQLAGDIAQAEALFRARQETLAAACEKRRSRLSKAHRASQRQVAERIELEEGRRKYELQKNLLETERRRKSDVAANDAAHQEFKARLAQNREAFIALEHAAQNAFRGYTKFQWLLFEAEAGLQAEVSGDEHELLAQLGALQTQTSEGLKRFRRFLAPAFFKNLPAWLLAVLLFLGHAALAAALFYFQNKTVSPQLLAVSLAVSLTLLVLAYGSGKRRAGPLAAIIANALERARHLHNVCLEKAADRHQQKREQIQRECQDRTRQLNEEWTQAVATAAAQREAWPKYIEEKTARAVARHEKLRHKKLDRLEQDRRQALARLKEEAETCRRRLSEGHQQNKAQAQADHQSRQAELAADWQSRLRPVFEAVRAANAAAEAQFPDWRSPEWKRWAPPQQFANAVPFARLEVEVAKLCDAVPEGQGLALPGPSKFSLPLILTYPRQGSLLLETTKSGSEPMAGALNNVILRLLSQAVPGRLSFTIIDPVKLGQSFAGVMHLADYEENLINSRIWTQPGEIEHRLADLNEHMEKVIQMYLRNEYATIAEYNEQAGNIAEKYHFLVVADFPVNFSETAVRRLLNIAASGARCGVYTLIHWDRRQVLPPDFVLDELRKNSVCVSSTGHALVLASQPLSGTRLLLEAPPPPELATDLLRQVGLRGRNANRVEVPFAQVAPQAAELWSCDTTEELRVPIGRTGATKLQYLAIGKGTRQHALIAGKTGSGKSTLFHVVITNLALWCRPEQVEFYLVDFKKGVEFKCYAAQRLPHARVVAIESDREFGLSVLQRVDEELKRRGDMFRTLGVQDIAGYKKAGGTEPIPRSLLIIDEFQEFFVEDDRISQGAAVLLDRIVRQGRAFGIHVLLGSQTLGGAYTLARTTIGQMVIRIALQCNEADAYLIMDENNPAPRLLSRPGEGIYNDMAGALEGNSPFQTVWLSEEEREKRLDSARLLADQAHLHYPGPFVFEGNAPADVRENAALRALLEAQSVQPPPAARLWLGAPNAIKGPTEAVFHRQSGNNLLLVGQRDEAVLAILSIGLVSLAAQYPPQAARFVFFDTAPPGSLPRDLLERITRSLPHETVLGKSGELGKTLGSLVNEMKRRADDEQAAQGPVTFLFVNGLQNFKKLRQEEDFGFSVGDTEKEASSAALLNDLVCGGAAHGIHVVASCDTFNNVNRFLGRKSVSEFEMRVLFQMSANDSASLIDTPKASTLGLHRALFYNEHEGYLETFRPYALPQGDWLQEAATHLARLHHRLDPSLRPNKLGFPGALH